MDKIFITILWLVIWPYHLAQAWDCPNLSSKKVAYLLDGGTLVQLPKDKDNSSICWENTEYKFKDFNDAISFRDTSLIMQAFASVNAFEAVKKTEFWSDKGRLRTCEYTVQTSINIEMVVESFTIEGHSCSIVYP
jgi:hypothetical protein